MNSDQTAPTSETKLGLIGANSRTRPWAYIEDRSERPAMNRVGALVFTALLILSTIGAGTGAVVATPSDIAGQESDSAGVPGGLMQTDDTTNETNTTTENETTTTTDDGATESNDSETTIDAGAQLAGVIGSQQAEHESAVQTRAFDRAFERAATNESQAAVVATSSERIEEQIQVLENQSDRLEEQYENGSLPESAYHARLTVLTARITALETQANRTSTRAKTLPEAALEARGMNSSDLQHLETRVRNVTSPQASAIAKRVAGPKVGHPTGPPSTVPGHDGERGPPGASNQSEKPGNGPPDSPPGQSENRTRGPGNDTTSNASAIQGPGDTPANNASTTGNGINPQNATTDPVNAGNNDVTPVKHGQNYSPFDELTGAQHASGNGSPGDDKSVPPGHQSSQNSSNPS